METEQRIQGDQGSKRAPPPPAAAAAAGPHPTPAHALPSRSRPPLQPLAIGDRQFESIDEAWAHINRVKQRLLALGRPVGPSDPDFGCEGAAQLSTLAPC